MYRNCPEHPKIKEVMRKGELNVQSIRPCFQEYEMIFCAAEADTICLPDEEFREICLMREKADIKKYGKRRRKETPK